MDVQIPAGGGSRQSSEKRRHGNGLRSLIDDEVRRHRWLFVAGLLVLAMVSLLALLTFAFQTLPLDLGTTLALQGVAFPPFHHLMHFVSWFGYLPQAVLVVLVCLLLVTRSLGWKPGAFLALLTILQRLANMAIKTGIGRPRPADDLVAVLASSSGSSFPSGHVMFFTVLFGFLFFLARTHIESRPRRRLALSLTGSLVLLVGPSRIYVGVHWLSDVIAAYLLGFIFLFFGIEFYLKYFLAGRPARNEEAASP